MRLHDRFEKGIYAKERESLSLVQRKKKGNERIYSETNKKEIYSTIKVITDCAGILCGEKG